MPIPEHINKLISAGESQELDFKYEISDARKIARTFVAFANTNGGRLLIGVNDDGSIAGIKSFEEYYMAEKAALKFCRPSITVRIKEWKVEGKKLLEIIVPESITKPHYALNDNDQWKVYVRINDQNHPANRIIVSAFLKQARSEGVYLEYTDHERILLKYLQDQPWINLPDFMSVSGLPVRKASTVISNFIAMGILSFTVHDQGFVYTLNKEFQES